MVEELIEGYEEEKRTAIKQIIDGYTAQETAAIQHSDVSVIEKYWNSFRRDVEDIIS